MNQKEAANQFAIEFQKKLKETPFPDEFIPFPDRFDNIKHLSLQYESPQTCGFPWEEYRVFLMKNKGYTMFEFAQISNIIQKRTPIELNMFPEYYDLQHELHKAGIKWLELSNALREAAERKVEIMAGAVRGINGKGKIIQA